MRTQYIRVEGRGFRMAGNEGGGESAQKDWMVCWIRVPTCLPCLVLVTQRYPLSTHERI
jgi:hypothetical protein